MFHSDSVRVRRPGRHAAYPLWSGELLCDLNTIEGHLTSINLPSRTLRLVSEPTQFLFDKLDVPGDLIVVCTTMIGKRLVRVGDMLSLWSNLPAHPEWADITREYETHPLSESAILGVLFIF
jgi:hypothetical protein